MPPGANIPDASSAQTDVPDAPKAILDYLAKHGSITRLDVEKLCRMTTRPPIVH